VGDVLEDVGELPREKVDFFVRQGEPGERRDAQYFFAAQFSWHT
jgi:hypothetical protein